MNIVPSEGYFEDTQPSWTGRKPRSASGAKRFQHWLLASNNTCIPYEEESFTDNINWRMFRIMAEFVEGFDFLAKLHHEVTFFGGAMAKPGSIPYEWAQRLGFLCGKAGYTVITGGGPGIMEAGNRGAYEAGGESVGLDISLPMEQRRNPYVKRGIGFNYFFTRKVMLSASAQAYVFFPGGFGTMDELFEMVTLVQTKKMSDEVPIILVGKTFWQPMLNWAKTQMLDQGGFIDALDLNIFQLVDSAEEAFAIIEKTHERML